jgi:hypothetical protein
MGDPISDRRVAGPAAAGAAGRAGDRVGLLCERPVSGSRDGGRAPGSATCGLAAEASEPGPGEEWQADRAPSQHRAPSPR